MSIAQKSGSAALLLLGRKAWGVLVNLIVMAILARKLELSDFGILAVSQTLISIIASLGTSGIAEYIIMHRKKGEPEVDHAAYWLNLVLTIFVAFVVIIVAPFWANYYKDSRITNIIYLLVVNFVFNMHNSIPIAIFRRELNYKPLVFTETIANIIQNILKVMMALNGFGVYSLALPLAIVSPFYALGIIWISGYRPTKDIGIRHWGKILGYTKFIIGTYILNKVVNEGDNLIVGKFLGLTSLGMYSMAFQVANLVNSHLIPIINNLSLPVFARDNDNIKLTRERYLKTIFLIAFLITPIYGLLIIYAKPLILTWYGFKWEDAIIPLQILSVFAMFRALSSPTSGLLSAMNKPNIGFQFAIIFAPIFLGIMFVFKDWGMIWFCWAVSISRIIGGQINILFSLKTINASYLSYLYKVYKPFLCALLAAIPTILFFQTELWFVLISGIGFIIIYLLFGRILFYQDFIDVLALIGRSNSFTNKIATRIIKAKL